MLTLHGQVEAEMRKGEKVSSRSLDECVGQTVTRHASHATCRGDDWQVLILLLVVSLGELEGE